MLSEKNQNDTENKGVRLYKLNPAAGGLGYSAAVVALLLSSVLFAVLQLILIKSGLPESSPTLIYINFFASPVAICAAVAAVLKLCKIPFKAIVPVKCKFQYYIIAVLIIFGMLFSMSWINDVFVEVCKIFGYKESATLAALEKHLGNMSGWELIPAVVIIALIPAALEELLFRGLILNSTLASAGTVATVLLSGFAFSLFHGSPEQTVYQFILGCLFALVAVKSGSILPSVLMHFINNALVVFLIFFHAYGEDGSLLISRTGNIILTVVSALCLAGGVIWLALDKVKIKKGEKGGVKNFFLYGSVGIGVMALLWLISLFGAG